MEQRTSPRWNTNTKLVVGFSVVAILAAFLVKFQSIVTPLLMSVILVYLLYPVSAFINKRLRFSWDASVAVVYILLILILVGIITLSGLEVIHQLESLLKLARVSLDELPRMAYELSNTSLQIGPFTLDFRTVDIRDWSSQLTETAQTMLGQTGQLVGALAGQAASTGGWLVFVLLISYFMLAESGGLREGILRIDIPGYTRDIERMGNKLGHIWNAFLRGQLILISLATVIYTGVLGGLGVSYALGLALMAGIARFLPYVGPAISWTILALVTYYQEYKLPGMSAFNYTLLILIIAWVIDGILDNIVQPRIMAEALKIHPAAVLVAAIIAFDLLGLMGMVIAAPILATFQLLARYVVRKLFDLDPWEGIEETDVPPSIRRQIKNWWRDSILPILKVFRRQTK